MPGGMCEYASGRSGGGKAGEGRGCGEKEKKMKDNGTVGESFLNSMSLIKMLLDEVEKGNFYMLMDHNHIHEGKHESESDEKLCNWRRKM